MAAKILVFRKNADGDESSQWYSRRNLVNLLPWRDVGPARATICGVSSNASPGGAGVITIKVEVLDDHEWMNRGELVDFNAFDFGEIVEPS